MFEIPCIILGSLTADTDIDKLQNSLDSASGRMKVKDETLGAIRYHKGTKTRPEQITGSKGVKMVELGGAVDLRFISFCQQMEKIELEYGVHTCIIPPMFNGWLAKHRNTVSAESNPVNA